MKAEKDPKTGKWLIQYRYKDWTGATRKSTKRGFQTKREAEAWVSSFLLKQSNSLHMKFSDFVDIYLEDMQTRLREHTMISKEHIVRQKLIPYFGEKSMCEITVADVRAWQNVMIRQGYSQTYLKAIHNQLSAVFNYAVNYYNLESNPCRKAGSMGKCKAEEMQIWTIGEFELFLQTLVNKPASWLAFRILFWTGIRIGELLALTTEDVDMERNLLTVNKSYQRLRGKDVVTAPKTPKSNRTVNLPDFLVADIRAYRKEHPQQPGDRLLPVSKTCLEHEMHRGILQSGMPRIRIHDLRHSHVSLLIELGFSAKEIAERLGHENIETTLNTYSHLYPNKQARIADRLEAFYREQTGAASMQKPPVAATDGFECNLSTNQGLPPQVGQGLKP